MTRAAHAVGGLVFEEQTNGDVTVSHKGKVVQTFDADGSVDMEINQDITGDLDITGNSTISGTLAVTGAITGVIARSTLTQEDAAVYPIPLHSLRNSAGAALGTADDEDSGNHYLAIASDIWSLYGNSPNSDAQTDASHFQFALPPEYVDGETITVRISALYTADGDSKTLDLEAYQVSPTTGAVGADICATTIKTLTGTAVNYDFTITPTGVAAGDLLNFKIQTIFEDTDGADGEAKINYIAVLLDIQG